jgi:hypothetical protein
VSPSVPYWPNGRTSDPFSELAPRQLPPIPIDNDSPIPFTLTNKGHDAVKEAVVEELISTCSHQWLLVHGTFFCKLCPGEKKATSTDHFPRCKTE